MSVPLVCDEGHLEQGGDVEHADEESDGDGVHLAEEEDEGGGEGAGQGEQQELLGDDQDGCSIRRIRNIANESGSVAFTYVTEECCKHIDVRGNLQKEIIPTMVPAIYNEFSVPSSGQEVWTGRRRPPSNSESG